MALNRDTVIILNLVLLSAIVFCGEVIYSTITAALFEIVPALEKTLQTNPTGTDTAIPKFQDYAEIKNRDLFRAEKRTKGPIQIDLAHLKPTNLKLKLWGTVNDESNRHTYAVIEDIETRKQGLYRPGASIRKAIVKRVTREAVVLIANGRNEVLKMASLPVEEPDNIDPDIGDLPERRIALDRSLFEQATRDISYLMNPAGLTRYTENDQYAGLLVTTLWPNSIFRILGLRNGDVLTLVAGKPVTSANDVATLFEGLRAASNTVVQIKRQDRLQMLTYDIY